ncbi:hypothetical protein SARC_08219 [Sphaeroforma arctica JP610]|uniref:Acyltransferase n=1 Tax=Sphaeroforma arctica JP610 TaxID=667725 RepID=A0A0L0FRE1_9EUKA|nr:hypothetical protein SARC_08219 [Sphaeroforma arctica JP610]KNC79392.1 hypothetical protein SARC_08219 [Sphaeroforma arctica JP610]|eukprot:XP_014153294.1 hypothetical protein SARC_08219 [Sphaeroforma arctica JP610]
MPSDNDGTAKPQTSKSSEGASSPMAQASRKIKSTAGSVANQVQNGVKKLVPQTEFYWPEWVAPLSTPISRRRQTLVVLLFLSMQSLSVVLTVTMLYNIMYTWWFMIPYLTWVYVFDAEGPKRPGRRQKWFRDLPLMKWFADYFPISLHKTVDLDPKRNYLFAYHPHGIIGIGVVTSFGTNSRGVDEMFPGIQISPMTLSTNFRFPFYRDYLMALGFADVGRTSINNHLGPTAKPGSSCLIVVGGAAEALDAIPETMDLTVLKRKGFVKMAIRNGAPLVPVIGFGENNLWDQVPNPRGSDLRERQNGIMKRLGFSTPLLFGRGVFQYRYGIVPYRAPVHVVGTYI